MRRFIIASLILFVLLAFAPASARADCEECARRAAQFWPSVHAEITSTSPALADYLARNEITHGRADKPVYFLTPDCGLLPGQLEDTLNVARALNIRTTIFLMGAMIDKWPDQSRALLKRVVDEGHELALHSYSHRNFRDLSREEIYDEVVRNWALIDWGLGYHYPIRFIRFPYGARNQELLQVMGEMGLQSVFWDIDSMGWRDFATVPIVHTQVTSKMRQGAVVVLHCSSVMDRAALPLYVNDLRLQGLEPAPLGAFYPRPTASDLAGYPRPRPIPTPLQPAPGPVEPTVNMTTSGLTPTASATATATAAATTIFRPVSAESKPAFTTPAQRRLNRLLDLE